MHIKEIALELDKHPAGTFLNLVQFNDHHLGACQITGTSPVWEMHPDTDELFWIIAGEFEITLRLPEGEEHHTVRAGSCFVVPKGIWHKPAAPKGSTFAYLTPGQTLHSDNPSV